MGQDRSETLRLQYLLEAERWAFPVTEWEIAAVSAILLLATVRVVRLDPAFLLSLGMIPKQCHRNAQNYAGRMKRQGVRMITGWIKQPRVLTLHSVVQLDDRYFCVTPTAAEPGLEFDFIPDPDVEVTSVSNGFELKRKTFPLGIGLRRFARADQPWFSQAAARLRSGMNPDEAFRFTVAPGSDKITTSQRSTDRPGDYRYNWRRHLG